MDTPADLASTRDVFRRASGTIAAVLMRTNGLVGTGLEARRDAVLPLLVGVSNTSGAVLRVGDHPSWLDESYMLGRALVERQINAAFLMVCDDDDYEGAVQHPLHYRWHHRSSEATVGPYKVEFREKGWPEDPSEVPGLEGAIDRFTSRKGRAKSWTDLTIPRRMEVVAARSPECMPEFFALTHNLVYSRASEAMHGSVAGMLSFLPNGPSDPEQMMRHRAGELTALFAMLARTTGSLLWVLRQGAQAPEVDELVGQAIAMLGEWIDETKLAASGEGMSTDEPRS